MPDVTSIYRVPLLLEDQKVVEFFATRLDLPLPTPRPRKFLVKWRDLADRCHTQCLALCLSCYSCLCCVGTKRLQVLFRHHLVSD